MLCIHFKRSNTFLVQIACDHTNRLFLLPQLPDRILQKHSISLCNLPWERKAMLPVIRQCFIDMLWAVRHSHPADLNHPSIFCPETLRRIKVKTIIPQMIFGQLTIAREISFHKKIPGLIDISVFPFSACKSLYGSRKHFSSADLQILRTFPHTAEFLPGGYLPRICPVLFI